MLTPNKNLATLYAPLTHSKVGLGNSIRTGEKPPLSTVVFLCLPKIIKAESIRFNSFMVGVRGTLRGCWNLFPVYQPFTSTAQSLVTFGGGLKTTEQELVMSQHHYTQETAKQKPLNNPVSPIKDPETLDNIINEIFRTVGTCKFSEKNALEYGELSRLEVESLKRDAEYLINACDKALRTPRPPKDTLTSRFNVLAKDTRRLLASHVTFEKAIKCRASEETIIKFAGMVGGIA